MLKYAILWNLFLVVAFLSSSKGNTFEEHQNNVLQTSPSGTLIKEALRQVFRIPDGEPTGKKTMARRPLRFMMKMYKKVSTGETSLPPQANTIRGLVPLNEVADSHSLRYGFVKDNFLLYNVTTSHQERLLTSYLHLMGHRRTPNRVSRLLFYLERLNETTRNNRPVMVAFIKELPMDIDITRVALKAQETEPSLLLRLEEEQMRRGRWVKSSSKRLLKKTPMVVLVSSDATLLDLEAFGVGALDLKKEFGGTVVSNDEGKSKIQSLLRDSEAESNDDFRGFRSRRSIIDHFDSPKNDFNSFENSLTKSNKVSEDSKEKKDKFWLQKQAMKMTQSDRKNTKPQIFLNHLSNNREEKFLKNKHTRNNYKTNKVEVHGNNRQNYYHYDPFATNSFTSAVAFGDPSKAVANPGFGNVSESGFQETRAEKKGKVFQDVEDFTEKRRKIKEEKFEDFSKKKDENKSLENQEEEIENRNLLPPLKEFRPLPKSERPLKGSKSKKGNNSSKDPGGLIPFPEHFVSWEKWESPRSAKWRRRYRKGRRKRNKHKRGKAKGIPDHWITVATDGMKNTKDQLTTKAKDKESPPDGVCGRHEFYVDFRELGWEKFIVTPKGFGTYFCSGVCRFPLSKVEAGTNHAIVQSLLRATNHQNKLPAACCVPGKLDSLTVLMAEESGRLALRTFPNMVVKSCSCQ